MTPQHTPPLNAKGEVNNNAWVAPFWLVETLEEQDDCNMVLKYKLHKIDEVEFFVPVLVNKASLQAGDVLTWCKKNIPEPGASSMVKMSRS